MQDGRHTTMEPAIRPLLAFSQARNSKTSPMVHPSSSPRETLLELFHFALDAANGRQLLARNVSISGGCWRYRASGVDYRWPLMGPDGEGLWIFGAGKAAASMAAGLERSVGEQIVGGCVIVKHGHGEPLERIEVLEGSHPIPSTASLTATRQLLDQLRAIEAPHQVLFLLSGGASALLAAPAQGLSLADKQSATELLIKSGASIDEINAVRKHLSAVKGGGVLRHSPHVRYLTIIISDVVGDDLATIGSGPTAADPTTFRQALDVLRRYGLQSRVSAGVLRHLEAGVEGLVSETVKSGDPLLKMSDHLIVASNRHAINAAQRHGRALGFEVYTLAEMGGETHQLARAFAARLRELGQTQQPALLIAGGETTLEVTGSGLGGRNQQFAVAVAREIASTPGLFVLVAGTDGTDGPTDAAGALVDSDSLRRATAAGLSVDEALAENDCYPLLSELGDLLITGPTGTNVMDLAIGLYLPS